jgi:hypothetical protein
MFSKMYSRNFVCDIKHLLTGAGQEVKTAFYGLENCEIR